MKAIFKAALPFFVVCSALLLLLFFSLPKSSADEKTVSNVKTPYIEFTQTHLKDGRNMWLANCESCHAYGVGDAPIPMQAEEWKDRVIKSKTELYDHAINGFFGADDAMMPARGGNPDLTDEEVKAAVDYMVALASYYIKQSQDK